MNYAVEIRQDIIGIPHIFLIVIDAIGIENGYGFAPLEHGNLVGDGNIVQRYYHGIGNDGIMPLSEIFPKQKVNFVVV